MRTIEEVKQTYLIDDRGVVYNSGFAGLLFPVEVKQDSEGNDIVELLSWDDKGNGLKLEFKIKDLMEKYYPAEGEKELATVNELETVLRAVASLEGLATIENVVDTVNMDDAKIKWALAKLKRTTYIRIDDNGNIILTRKGEKQMDKFKAQDLEKHVQEPAPAVVNDLMIDEFTHAIISVVDELVERSNESENFDDILFQLVNKITDINSDREVEKFLKTLRVFNLENFLKK